MEDVNWSFQIINWIITIGIVPFLAHFFTKKQMEKQHKNNKVIKNNDLELTNLVELEELLKKSLTSCNMLVTKNKEYFEKVNKGKITYGEESWEKHQEDVNKYGDINTNYISRIDSKLMVLGELKECFEKEEIEVNYKKYNYIKFDISLRQTIPNYLLELSINNKGTVDDLELDKYLSFYFRYSDLILILLNKIKERIDSIKSV
ncbi:hypothetical protein KJB62_07310 [Staphylococcus saprophyticus]|uniref:hypothetical protein n=1 Tax=Staphylococcus saprophyticus TaxID=29385 RepID=UPI001F3477B0|nr:hypothetical protein [Staphylococcus saprophyticus]MCE5131197.1 hypothetical protein [Staphylococcus saprophyticus]